MRPNLLCIAAILISSSNTHLNSAAPSQKRPSPSALSSSQDFRVKQYKLIGDNGIDSDLNEFYPTRDIDEIENDSDYYQNDEPTPRTASPLPKSSKLIATANDKNKQLEWRNDVIKKFAKWGYTDSQIPNPIGSRADIKLHKPPPKEFVTVMMDVISTAPDTMKAKLQEILEINKLDAKAGKPSGNKSGSGFKTICEEKNGKCEESKSSNPSSKEPSEDINKSLKSQTKQSLDQILRNLQDIIDQQNKLTEVEATQIHKMIVKMAEMIHELQDAAKRACPNPNDKRGEVGGKNTKKQWQIEGTKEDILKPGKANGPITEVEERHTVERKIVKHKEHDDMINENNQEFQNTYISMQQTVASELPISVSATEASNLNNFQDINVGMESMFPQQTTINYLGGQRADVNYNGGINKHMDELKKQYPHGHWPDETTELDYGAYYDESLLDNLKNDPESSTVKDIEDIRQEEHLLTPQYLEAIIRRERLSGNISTQHHHVQEHELPMR